MLKKFLKTQLCYLVIFSAIFLIGFTNQAFAIYQGARDSIAWDGDDNWQESANMCDTGSIAFDPLGPNKDVTWEVSNPVCIGWVTAFGTAMAGAQAAATTLCHAKNVLGAAKIPGETSADPTPPNPTMLPIIAYKMALKASQCASRTAELTSLTATKTAQCLAGGPLCGSAITQVALATTDQIKCCAGAAALGSTVAAGIGGLGAIYEVAKHTYENAKICGQGWNNWNKFDVNGEKILPVMDGTWRQGSYEGSYQHCIESIFVNKENPCGLKDLEGDTYYDDENEKYNKENLEETLDKIVLTIENKHYREYLYGGQEFEDNGSGSCTNPWSQDKRQAILGYKSDAQRYYMKGSALPSNYSCHRFLVSSNPKTDEDSNKAYECCKKRSQNTICIVNSQINTGGDKHRFCQAGSRCDVETVTFETFWSNVDSNFLCAKTYSLCPYNHLLGGGTERIEYVTGADDKPTTRIDNFCQVRNHCVKLPVLPYVKMSDLDSAFISSACKDLKGDTQNIYNFDAGILPLNSNRGFSSPLIQCFKETIQNLLTNKAGDTKCLDPSETPSINETCKSGYLYQEGQYLNEKSPFVTIQSKFYWAIKLVLTLAISIFGAKVLLGMQPIERKKLSAFLIKITVVMYFALGTGWHDIFIDGVLDISTTLGEIVMRIDESQPENMKDGCQFPRFNADLDADDPARFDDPKYPQGLGYLKIWDTLDCKLSRALGYGPEVSVPNILLAMVGGFFTGGLGIVFVVVSFLFAFFFLALVLRAMHIFLLSTIAIVILIYVSPLVITMILFEKTKSIFDGWLKQLIGFILQPVILFAYLGMFIAIFEFSIMGPVKFDGDGKEAPKQIICDSKSENTSMYCIFRIADFKSYSGLEAIGITIPVLTSMNQEKFNTIVKAALLMFIFASFMEKVSTLAKTLVGGSELKSSTPTVQAMARTAYGAGQGVRKRGTRAMKSTLQGAGKRTASAAKSAANYIGNKGKSVEARDKTSQNDNVTRNQPESDRTVNQAKSSDKVDDDKTPSGDNVK